MSQNTCTAYCLERVLFLLVSKEEAMLVGTKYEISKDQTVINVSAGVMQSSSTTWNFLTV